MQNEDVEDEAHANLQKQLAGRKITCRLCQGDHYTTRCPYKDTLGDVLGGGKSDRVRRGAQCADIPLSRAEEGGAEGSAAPDLPAGASPSEIRAAGGKYVPPSMRAGAKGLGESMNSRNRDDMPTLRVTNLSEDCTDADMWELFPRFGKVNR